MTRETFSNLILDSEPTLYRVAMSMLRNEKDCEDAVQTAILTAFEKLGMLRREEYFKTWLVRILINVCNKQLRGIFQNMVGAYSDKCLQQAAQVRCKNSRAARYRYFVRQCRSINRNPYGNREPASKNQAGCRALLHRAIHRQGDKANPENSRGHRQKPPEQRSGAVERLLNRMKITPVAEMQQGIIISFYAIFFTFSARNPPLSNVL